METLHPFIGIHKIEYTIEIVVYSIITLQVWTIQLCMQLLWMQ